MQLEYFLFTPTFPTVIVMLVWFAGVFVGVVFFK